MPAISSLVKKLAADYPGVSFEEASRAHWSPTNHTVYYSPAETHPDCILLHETSHALLNHQQYYRDIELLKIERAAWTHAATVLAPLYGVTISAEFIEAQLDTYRDWLHTKSTCPSCHSNGLEQDKLKYFCLHCGTAWRTNVGVDVGIRRFATT